MIFWENLAGFRLRFSLNGQYLAGRPKGVDLHESAGQFQIRRTYMYTWVLYIYIWNYGLDMFLSKKQHGIIYIYICMYVYVYMYTY